MIRRDHKRGRNHDGPIAIEREESQRSKDVEMRFNSSAAKMDQQCGHEHLAGGDDISRRAGTCLEEAQDDGENVDGSAENNCDPDVKMNAAFGSRPGAR